MALAAEIFPWTNKGPLNPLSYKNGTWCLGEAMSQGINNGFVLDILKYSTVSPSMIDIA